MSTRAVYSFKCELTDETIYFYKHHDGYPQGAHGALKRIECVVRLENNLEGIQKIMKAIGGEQLYDYEEFIGADHQHRYRAELLRPTRCYSSHEVVLHHHDNDEKTITRYSLDLNKDEPFQ